MRWRRSLPWLLAGAGTLSYVAAAKTDAIAFTWSGGILWIAAIVAAITDDE